MQKGDTVLYVCHFDADPSDGSPNVCPAIVVQVNQDGTLDLHVMFLNGTFQKQNCVRGSGKPSEQNRGAWLPR